MSVIVGEMLVVAKCPVEAESLRMCLRAAVIGQKIDLRVEVRLASTASSVAVGIPRISMLHCRCRKEG